LAATGGLPPFGSQGSAPEMVLAVDFDVTAIKREAVESKRDLREVIGPIRVSTKCSLRFILTDAPRNQIDLQVPWHFTFLAADQKHINFAKRIDERFCGYRHGYFPGAGPRMI
jgi:hypothetical protein